MAEPQYRLEVIVRTKSELMEDFEGPLDVILELLSKNKIQIQDVSITAIIAIFGSLLCVGWLYLTGEVGRRRSLWMVTAFVCIAICVLISMLLNYPCPAPTV